MNRRRVLGSGLCLVAGGIVIGLGRHFAPTLRALPYFTGWALLAVMLFLTLYNARKKLPFLPLGRSGTWLQLHAYVGYFSGVLFLAHLSWRFPRGGFGLTLAALFVAVAGSGILGLWWSRRAPRRLTDGGGEVLFERIPVIRRELQTRAEALALESVQAGGTMAIAEFYRLHLADFFRASRNFAAHLTGFSEPKNPWRGRLEDLGRFLTPEQNQQLRELNDLIRQKDGLDRQYALQWSLKAWLFVHVPLTYSLLLATGWHVVLVHGFSLGASLR